MDHGCLETPENKHRNLMIKSLTSFRSSMLTSVFPVFGHGYGRAHGRTTLLAERARHRPLGLGQ